MSKTEELIPYIVEERPDTGLNNATLGIWLFLASEIMLFGGLFSSYVLLRTGAANWPVAASIVNVPIGTLNTLILVASSIFIIVAWAGLKEGNYGKFRMNMALSILGGLIFLVIKGFEYKAKFAHGHLPSSNNFLAIYFVLTGLHALHIIGGLIVNAYLLVTGSKMFKSVPAHFTHRVEIAGMYWHFVDLLWIILMFPVLYLL